ncbi:MAG: NAD-dependent dihydropyrimidine dehydrogenase subunit PreA [Candidatus Eisenbacteria sp.]|nr:NAD-dependent dihydropyrimidine dehydrogenase subunit PreA [Candidatus Eisenbacteria bacterium]
MAGDVRLSVGFCGLEFDSPFILAASPCTDDPDMVGDAFEAGWAGVVLKTTSVETEEVSLAYPMMSSLDVGSERIVGLGNIDLISEHHIDEVEKWVKSLKCSFPGKIVGASIMGAVREDWEHLVRRLEKAGADFIECSFSCPQGTLGSKPGAMLAQDPDLVRRVAGWIKGAAQSVPVIIKISPMVADIVEVAQAVKDSGADAVCASNTVRSLMGIDLDTFCPNPCVRGKSSYSGLSGPAIKPITLRVISEIARRVDIPITGTGGAHDWRDAAEFLLVGARTVQYCTAPMRHGFGIIDGLREGLEAYLVSKGLASPEDLVGLALPHIVPHNELPRRRIVFRILEDQCKRCHRCHVACHDGGHRAIKLKKDRYPEIDEERCVGCGLCVQVCPVDGCIEMHDARGT